MQNLTVVPFRDEGGTGCYHVVIGNRRMEASKKAGLETLPCIIAHMTHAEQVQTMLLENMQRVDLTVYEQAAGFQMMMDFGDSVEKISEKTGFSESTVRRRLKMAELDADTLKKVSDRQLSLGDFDKLAEIEDVAVRNKILEHIGTQNFDWHIAKAKEQQAHRRQIEAVRRKLTEAGLKEISPDDRLRSSNAFTGVCGNVGSQFRVDTTRLNQIDTDTYTGEGHCFYFDFNVWCYVVGPKPVAEEDEEDAFDVAEHEHEERYERLEEASERAYDLRLDFIRNISESEAKKHLSTAVLALSGVRSYRDFQGDLMDVLGIEEDDEQSEAQLAETVEKSPCRAAACLGYIAKFGLSSGNQSYNWRGEYTNSISLERIYAYLRDLGYEPSDEESALVDGTSELYLKEDAQ